MGLVITFQFRESRKGKVTLSLHLRPDQLKPEVRESVRVPSIDQSLPSG